MIAHYADHSANERTFLAWVRTAIAVVGFGIGVVRLNAGAAPGWSETVLLLSGAIVVVIAFLRLRHVRARINHKDVIDDDPFATDGLLIALIVALFGMLGAFAAHIS